MNPNTSRLTALLGTASFLALFNSLSAQAQVAQAQTAQASPQEVPEQVPITGSRFRGTAAVGVPVTNLRPADIRTTGAFSASDLFRSIPEFNVIPGPVGTAAANTQRGSRADLRQLDTGTLTRAAQAKIAHAKPAQPQEPRACENEPDLV